MKKIISMLLVALLAFSLSTAVFAADITIENGANGETYYVYKVFDATTSDANGNGVVEENEPVAYSIDSDSTAGAPIWALLTNGLTADANGVYTNSIYGLKFVPSVSDATVYVVYSTMTDDQAAALAAALKSSISTLTNAKVGEITYSSTNPDSNTLTGVGTGYYFVNSSLGSLCSLATEDSEQTIEEKNSAPTLTKLEMDSNADTLAAASITASAASMQIGDTIWYKIVVTDGKGTDKDIVVYDVMSPGLTLDANSFTVSKKVGTAAETPVDSGSTTWAYAALTTVPTGFATGSSGFTVTINADLVASLDENDTVTIIFRAKMDQDAVAGTKETNTAWLTYSEQESAQVPVTALTYKFEVLKYNADDTNKAQLPGAVFELRDGDTVVKLIKVSDTEYRVADADEVGGTASSHKPTTGTTPAPVAIDSLVSDFVTVASDNIVITGVDVDSGNGTAPKAHNYRLVEIMAPEGFNLMSEAVTVTVAAENNLVVEVPNQAGTILPSTGGIGTTIFYILGGIFAVGAAVILIARKRVSE